MFDIKDMVWSFSRVNSFNTCPYGWYVHYLLRWKNEGSAFTEVGLLMHDILEKYAKNELTVFDVSTYFEEHFAEWVQHAFPPGKVDLRQKYYDDCLEYLDNINLPLLFKDYEILGVEKEVKFKVGKYDFIGYIDLLLRGRNTGDIMILDHKSANLKFKKNGDISKTDLEHYKSFKRQLYLYSKAVIEEYGEEPGYLAWNLFRSSRLHIIPWKKEDYEEALKWGESTIDEIVNEALWLPDNSSKFFCNNICGQRNNCEYKELS